MNYGKHATCPNADCKALCRHVNMNTKRNHKQTQIFFVSEHARSAQEALSLCSAVRRSEDKDCTLSAVVSAWDKLWRLRCLFGLETHCKSIAVQMQLVCSSNARRLMEKDAFIGSLRAQINPCAVMLLSPSLIRCIVSLCVFYRILLSSPAIIWRLIIAVGSASG